MCKPFSIVSIALKGDSYQAYYAIESATRELRRHGLRMPLYQFNLADDLPTHVFNIFASVIWGRLSLDAAAAILACAAGLIYPPGYGPDYFGAQCFDFFMQALKRCPNAQSCAELYKGVQGAIRRGDFSKKALEDSELAQKTLRRMAEPIQLNASLDRPPFRRAMLIDFVRFFLQPMAVHFCLSAPLHPYSARDVARLILGAIMHTGQVLGRIRRLCNVLVFIDEFPDMQDYSLHQTLRYCRSHGIAIVLANQQRADLKHVPGMLDAVEGSIQSKFYCGLNSREDINWLCDLGGQSVETFRDSSESWGPQGASHSTSTRHVFVPRINTVEVAQASSIPGRCIAHITNEPWGGLPFEMDFEHDVAKTEYDNWENSTWPSDVPDTIIPRRVREEIAAEKKPSQRRRNRLVRVLSVERYKPRVDPTDKD